MPEAPSPQIGSNQQFGEPVESPRQFSAVEENEEHRRARRAFRRKRKGPNLGIVALVIGSCLVLLVTLVIGGLIAYRHFARSSPISNRERLVGTWEMQADEGRATLEFGSSGRFRAVTNKLDGGKLHENNGTWESLGENGNEIKIRTIASDGTDTYTHVWDLILLDDDTFTRVERQDQVFHRR
jgi:hypothetical protein